MNPKQNYTTLGKLWDLNDREIQTLIVKDFNREINLQCGLEYRYLFIYRDSWAGLGFSYSNKLEEKLVKYRVKTGEWCGLKIFDLKELKKIELSINVEIIK